MKIYRIEDVQDHKSVGTLLYYEKKKEFIVELEEYLDEWTAPLHFVHLVKRGIYTVPRKQSYMWVKARIIPSGRQNISEILKNHKLECYDEMKFLELSQGKCSQDNLYIKKIEELPEYICRRRNNLIDCVVCDDYHLLCFFENNMTRKVDLRNIIDVEGVEKVLSHKKLFQSCQISTGGYGVTFDQAIDIPAASLYQAGEDLPVKLNDFLSFARQNLLDTSEGCEILSCSRQNLAYMLSRKQLLAVKEDTKGNLFMKGDLLRQSW